MHIVVESLRNSFALLNLHGHQFITRTVDETDVTAFWQILGVDADALLSFAFANPWFSNNQLHVISEARFVENPMETVSWVVLFFCSIGESMPARVLAVFGVSMRAVLASVCCALDELIQRTRGSQHCTDCNLCGWRRLNRELKYK